MHTLLRQQCTENHFLLDVSDAALELAKNEKEEISAANVHLQVRVDAVDTILQFYQGERIHTENSYKHTVERLEYLLLRGGSEVVHTWMDPHCWFVVGLGVII